MEKEKVIVFGTGKASEYFVKADFNQNIFELVAFSDNNEQKHGTSFCGKKIVAPSELKYMTFDSIIIASTFYDEITKGLTENFNIDRKRIHNLQYRKSEQIKLRYQKYYENKKEICVNNGFKGLEEQEKVVVYTAITGGFDQLKEPKIVDKNFRYVCFTDRADLKSSVWEIKKIDIENNDLNRTAKRYKILPHQYFPNYKWSVWIDGQLEITGDLRKIIKTYNQNSNLMCFLHPTRNCIRKEAEICKTFELDDSQIIDKQIDSIMQTGFKDKNELIAGGFLVRQHNEKDVIKLMEDWWDMINIGSKRDQLSFNYIAWKNQFFFDVTDLNIMDNIYFKRYVHKKI